MSWLSGFNNANYELKLKNVVIFVKTLVQVFETVSTLVKDALCILKRGVLYSVFGSGDLIYIRSCLSDARRTIS